MHAETPDFAAITSRQQQTWATGDFNRLAMATMPVAEMLVESADPSPGHRVLDIACGSGNNALVAARRQCQVTGVDFVPALLEHARRRAQADGVQAEFLEGDAQKLPFADHSFDVVLSTFGVMFAPNQEHAAAEIKRVTRPGGKVAVASWMPEGFGGDIFRTLSKYAPPPPGLKPGTRWGTASGWHELFGPALAVTSARVRTFRQYFRNVDAVMDIFLNFFGPAVRVMQNSDDKTKAAFTSELRQFFTSRNRAQDGALILDCDYFEVVSRKV